MKLEKKIIIVVVVVVFLLFHLNKEKKKNYVSVWPYLNSYIIQFTNTYLFTIKKHLFNKNKMKFNLIAILN